MNFITFVIELRKLAYEVYGATFGFNPSERTATIGFKNRGDASARLADDCANTLRMNGYDRYSEIRMEHVHTNIGRVGNGKVSYQIPVYQIVVKLVNEDPKNTKGLMFEDTRRAA